jgi:hypothetical protein
VCWRSLTGPGRVSCCLYLSTQFSVKFVQFIRLLYVSVWLGRSQPSCTPPHNAARGIPVTFNTKMDSTFRIGLIMANENSGLRVEYGQQVLD